MDSRSYIERTRFDSHLMERQADSVEGKFGELGEFVIAAALTANVEALETVWENRHEFNARMDLLHAMGTYDPARHHPDVRKRLGSVLTSPTRTSADIFVKSLDAAKMVQMGLQAQGLAHYFLNKLGRGRGENSASFNNRMMRQTILPYSRNFAFEMTRSGATQREYSFAIDGTAIEYPNSHVRDALTSLHANGVEVDSFMAISHLIRKNKLPFIPIFTGETGNKYSNWQEEGSYNADIMLLHESGDEVVPVQVKVNARKHTEDYADEVVFVDCGVLGMIGARNKISRTKEGHPCTESEIMFTAGVITKNACRNYQKHKKAKTDDTIFPNPSTIDRLHDALFITN